MKYCLLEEAILVGIAGYIEQSDMQYPPNLVTSICTLDALCQHS
jgi:hypothetical protein